MEMGAISGMGTGEIDEIGETQTEWLGKSVERSNKSLPFCETVIPQSAHVYFPAKTLGRFLMMSKITVTEGTIKGTGGVTQDGKSYGEVSVTISFGPENKNDSRERYRDYEPPRSRDHDIDQSDCQKSR